MREYKARRANGCQRARTAAVSHHATICTTPREERAHAQRAATADSFFLLVFLPPRTLRRSTLRLALP